MATERLVLRIDEKGATVVSRKMENLGRSAQKAGGGVKLLRTALGALGTISIGLVFRNATRVLADFSQEMSTVRAITGATGSVFDEMTMKARELGATTRFSATEAAQGMTFLARAGFETDEVLSSIGPTLQLAQAGALDLGRAADLASNVLTGFNIEAADSARVIDVMALAANSANTNVEQLGEAMSYVAPVSAALGVSLEETTAAVQTLSDAGIQASRAGTNLTMVMRRLESPQGKQKAILKELGLELDDVRVSEVGLTKALENLRDSGASTSQIFDLFGRTAAAASVLLKGTEGKIQDFTKANMEAGGTAAEVAKIMDDNLNGALLAVKSAWQELQLAFGAAGPESGLTRFFQGLAGALRDMAANIDKVVDPLKFIKDVALSTFQALEPVVQSIADQFNTWGVNGESLMMTLDDIGIALVALLRTATQVVDGIISAFNIAGKVIAVSIYGGLNDASRFWEIATNKWQELTRDAINAIIRGFNRVATSVGIDPIGYLLPKQGGAVREAFSWGEEMGKAVADGFITPTTDLLDNIIAGIEDKQLARALETVKEQIQTANTEGPDAPAAPVPPELTEDAVDDLKEIAEAADLMGDSVKKSFDTATEALVDFTRTGKLEVREMVSDIISQLARLAAQKFFQGLAGGIGLPGFATGGSFMVGGSGGTDSQTVAFRATPGEQVTISTPGQQQPGTMAVPSVAAPQVNVKVVNVLDPSLITAAMSSEEGEEVIINVIQNNANAVKQTLS